VLRFTARSGSAGSACFKGIACTRRKALHSSAENFLIVRSQHPSVKYQIDAQGQTEQQ